jgi:predicted XRE-type DNA-binding protein
MAKSKQRSAVAGPERYLSVKEVQSLRRSTARAMGTRLPGPRATALEKAKFEVVQRLLRYMQTQALSQAALAKALGVTGPRLSKLLHNRTEDVTLDYLLRLYQRIHERLVVRIA